MLSIGVGTLLFFITQFIVNFLDKIGLKILNAITENQYSIELQEYLIPMALLNVPLYLLDLFTYAAQHIGWQISSASEQEIADSSWDIEGHNGGPKAMRLLALEYENKGDGDHYNFLSEPSTKGGVEYSNKDTAFLMDEGNSINTLTP